MHVAFQVLEGTWVNSQSNKYFHNYNSSRSVSVVNLIKHVSMSDDSQIKMCLKLG